MASQGRFHFQGAYSDAEKAQQAIYLIPQHPPHVDPEARHRARRRFLRAFTLTGLILLIFHVLGHAHLHGLFRKRQRESSPYQPVFQMPVNSPSCNRSWTFDPDGRAPINRFRHVAETSLEFSLPSTELFFEATGHGAFAHGAIEFTDSPEADSDLVKVEVTTYYNNVDDLLQYTRLCTRESPEAGHKGVLISGPENWSGRNDHHQVQWDVKVRLPGGSIESPRSITKLRTHMRLFAQRIGDIADRVFFDGLALAGANMPITVKSVAADTATIYTTNSPIEGSFNTSRSLHLATCNAPIKVDVGLLNEADDERVATKLDVRTSNGPVQANIALHSTADDEAGGIFDVGVMTSNSPLTVAIVDAPIDHTLFMHARTSNAPAHARLHSTYEGSYHLFASTFFRPTVRASEVDDPTGRGRHRSVSVQDNNHGVVQGSVNWIPSDRKTNLGKVDISTSTLGLDLSL